MYQQCKNIEKQNRQNRTHEKSFYCRPIHKIYQIRNHMQPTTIEEVQQALRRSTYPILLRGGGTKNILSQDRPETALIDMSQLTGIIEYLPDEYTISAWAGTQLQEIQATLAGKGQYLPFDPPLVAAGATLGGTVAAGLSGSQRYRYGGVRDFIIGLRFIDGRGRIVQGGGKVVKNAAGFDLPKLMVGSLGSLGIIVETTFKVFPSPPAYATFQAEYATLGEALTALNKLTNSQLDLEALDLIPNAKEQNYILQIRIGGLAAVLPERLSQLPKVLGQGHSLPPAQESAQWDSSREFHWLDKGSDQPLYLIKVPITPHQIPTLESHLAQANAPRRYTVGGNLAWIGWPNQPEELDNHLTQCGLSGIILHATQAPDSSVPIYLGIRKGEPLLKRIKDALDPAGQFLEFS